MDGISMGSAALQRFSGSSSVAERIGEREERDKHRLTKQHLRVPSRKTGTKWAFALPLCKHALRTVLVEAVIERGGAKPLGNRYKR